MTIHVNTILNREGRVYKNPKKLGPEMGGRLRGMPSFVKPWTNGGASQCKFSTCVQLAFHLATPLH